MYVEYVPGEKHAGKNAERSDFPDAFQDCGLLLRTDDVVIDIDHLPKESIKALLTEFSIKTQVVWTTRGAHLYFTKPQWHKRRRDGICRLAFKIEQHTSTSRPEGMTIKRNGVMREIENEGARQLLPEIFDVPTAKQGKFEDLTGLQEGDGRNKLLFEHRIKLKNCTGWQKIISYINKWVFAEPLEDGEMSGLLRELDIAQESGSGNYEMAQSFINKYHITKWAGDTWVYDGTKYKSIPTKEQLAELVYAGCVGEDTKVVDEIMKQIGYRCRKVDVGECFPIHLQNGILEDGTFYQRQSFEEFTPYYIDIPYVSTSEAVQVVDDYIRNLTGGDHEYRDLLLEALGYALVTDPEKIRSLARFFMFRGDGANGKGTLLQIIQKILGVNNCTNLSIKQMADERYLTSMIGKLANLGDDIEPEPIDNKEMKVLKNITAADTISARKLYQESFSATFTAKAYFTTNHDIKTFEKGYAYERRVVWMPMFTKVDKPDPNFITKLTTPEALRYWVRLIVEGYMRLYKNGKWTSARIINEYNQAYHESNNPMKRFAIDLGEDGIKGHTITEIKKAFEEWDTDESKFTVKLFKSAVWEVFRMGVGFTRNGKSNRRVFMKQDETDQILEH